MRLALAVPNLLAIERAVLAGIPGLARLARYAGAPIAEPAGMDHALIVAAGLPRDTPVASLAARGAGLAAGAAFLLRADPVSLVAGRDDVLLAGRVDDLGIDDAAALVATLNGHFAGDGLVFHAPRPDAWFLTLRDDVRPVTTPLPAVRGAIYPHLPRGEHGKAWRRWMSEMQMLLHEHAVNAAREARGFASVTGIWVWGGGDSGPTRVQETTRILAPPGPAGDVARGLAAQTQFAAQPPPAIFAALPAAASAIVVLPAIADPPAASAWAHAWLDPALAALERGALSEFALLADGAGSAVTWNAPRPPWTLRTRARFAAERFAPPATDDPQ